MAKWKNSPNMDKYLSKLEKLTNTRGYIGEAVYDGAAVVADAMKAQIASLPVAQKFAKDGGKIGTITSVQKAGLVEGFGISKMRKDGDFYNVKLGFDGYDAGARILTDFFKEQLQQFMTDDLDPLGRQIIELVMQDAPLEKYLELTPMNLR